MPNILFISHRFPYPPDRGEKIRGWHLIQHMAKTHRVFLGCLVDDPREWQYRPTLEAVCTDLGAFPIDKRRQKLRALLHVRRGRALMLDYYYSRDLYRWIRGVLKREAIDLLYIYSTAMAPYVLDVSGIRKIFDMQDVDSEKWAAYALQSHWPARLLWAREARTLLAYEREAVRACEYTLLVTEAEARHLRELAPASRNRIGWLEQGVDLEIFAPGLGLPNPYPTTGPWLSFTGNMDYWPNIDAAVWFTHEVLPLIRSRFPTVGFAIVGANPGPEVRRLGDEPGVLVTGRVPDVRPYVAAATVSVAPLRIARGVQNKVLEAMAMARPVVATAAAFEGIRATAGRDLLVAEGAEAIANAIAEVLENHHPELALAGRRRVEEAYSWPSVMRKLDAILAGNPPAS